MLHDADPRAPLAAERDRLVARLDKGQGEYFGGFDPARAAQLARRDPTGYAKAEDLWLTLLRRYEAVCDQLAALDAHAG